MCARVLLLLLVLLSGSRFEAIVGWLLRDGVGAYDGVVTWRPSVSRIRFENGVRGYKGTPWNTQRLPLALDSRPKYPTRVRRSRTPIRLLS